ncbi:hypothetical protein F2Q68_00041464 [Brassica cretica]|uniref:Transducin/WD40 repeat-like superfamily protein n=1 Tax=Brassica cretica TaxID=69181 RepID=A0A8S9MLU1_BRACR|nr:hypothetical protein F2Q68_00041464 [Brassica cretica]
MMNTCNGMISAPPSSSSPAANPQSPGIKTYFKTPEGKYKLHYEKTHSSSLFHYAHGKTVTQVKRFGFLSDWNAFWHCNERSLLRCQVTLAQLKERAAPSTPTGTSSGYSSSSGFRSATARLLGTGNGNRALSFVGGNGSGKNVSTSSRISGSFAASNSSTSTTNTNFDGKGTYLVFNVGDAIFICDLNSQDKDPVKSIHFSNSNPMCHAFDPDAKDGHDLLIGLISGDVYTVSLRQQLQDVSKKLVGALHYNKDGSANNRQEFFSICVVCHEGKLHILQLIHIGFACSQVSGVAFDSYWSSPNTDGSGEHVMYRFGSVGQPSTMCLSHTLLHSQDTQLLLWDLEMDEIVVPLRRPPGGSPTYSTGSQSAHWDNAIPMGTLQPAPCKRDVPKLSPVIAHRVHTEPLSGLMFTQESVVTACREGHIKIWTRPSASETQTNSSEANPAIALLSSSFPKDNKGSLSSKIGGSSLKQ